MALTTIPAVGQYGIVADTLPQELPLGAWSAGTNVRFIDGAAERVGGHVAAFTTPTVTPYYVAPYTTSTARFWIHAGLARVFCDDGTTKTDITNATPYTGAIDNRWTGGSFNGVLLLNNGKDQPQFWGGSIATPLAPVTGWDATWTCNALRPFKNYIFALGMVKGGVAYPNMVKWSTECAPGTITASGGWDISNPAIDAGEVDLAETPDIIVDALPMGDQFIIYKERSTYSCQYIGQPEIFQFRKLPSAFGMLARGCAVDTPVGHIVLTAGDLVVHQGLAATSLLEGKWRKLLFTSIDSVNYARSFLAVNPRKNEVWVCYPDVGQASCTSALIYNWLTGAVGQRQLPKATYGNTGQINLTGGDAWSSDSFTWAQTSGSWGQNEYSANEGRLVLSSTEPNIILVDTSVQFESVNINASLERTGMAFDTPGMVKLIRSVTPRIDAPMGTVLQIQVCGAMDTESAPIWSAPVTYTVGTTRKADCIAAGRFLGVRITSSSAQGWRIHSLDVDVAVAGAY